MYAIIETGGKQYRVTEGDQVRIEKIKAADGEQVKFDKVLVLGDGAEAKVGAPYVDGAAVFGDVIETGKGKKVIIFKYKAKKDYRKKQGHRQPYTLVEITGISADGTAPAKKAAPKAEVPAEPADTAEPAKKPSLKSMKKAELIEFAKENSIEIDEKATKPVILEAIEAALK
ncbi:50S ribosomal protein L21 [bacterium 210820-DFI.6.37]|nr:50S ribosomal protein L21 [bacterium 210820-DFI.6.37]